MKEYLVRLIYCEMLGHDVAFGHFQAVRMTQSVGLLEKRVGYLASCVLLHEHHELIVLLINTLQRDLKSSNLAEICMALTTISRLMNAEMTPAVLPLVVKHLTHEREIVRKKAVLALHRCFTRTPDGVIHLADAVRRALCDSDPSVMCASLNLLYDMALADPAAFKDLTSSFVSILKQIIEHRLVREFDYHKVPAPWMQVKLLKVLAILGADDQRYAIRPTKRNRSFLCHLDISATHRSPLPCLLLLLCCRLSFVHGLFVLLYRVQRQ